MAAVAVVCRGVRLHVARHVLHRAPLLLNTCSDEPQEAEEEVSLDRDPAAARMVLEYCETGIITQQMLTDHFFAEADYFGVAPLRRLVQPTREQNPTNNCVSAPAYSLRG
jgi:BTB/POZ domain